MLSNYLKNITQKTQIPVPDTPPIAESSQGSEIVEPPLTFKSVVKLGVMTMPSPIRKVAKAVLFEIIKILNNFEF